MASSQVLTSVNEVKKRTRKGWRSLGGGGWQMQGALTACLPAACDRRWCPYDQSQAEAGGASSGSGPLAEHLRACSVAGKDET